MAIYTLIKRLSLSLVIQKLRKIHVNNLLVAMEPYGFFGHPLWVISKISMSGNRMFSLVTLTLSPRGVSKAAGLARTDCAFEKYLMLFCCYFLFFFLCSFQKVHDLDSSANWWLQRPQSKGNCKMRLLVMRITLSSWLGGLKVAKSRIHSQFCKYSQERVP